MAASSAVGPAGHGSIVHNTWEPHAKPHRVRGAPPCATGSASSAFRSTLGPESRLPNVYFNSLSPGSLRRLHNFTALPPPDLVELNGDASYRYVRQESSLWSELHAGRLTTSRFKDALGLRDRTAARVVGGPQAAEQGVNRAYAHLLQPLHVPPATTPRAGADVTDQRAAGAGEEAAGPGAAGRINEEARLRYNEELWAEAAAGREAEPEPGWSEADQRRISEAAALAVGAAGALRLRLLWGTLQEGAALATLGQLFPSSQLEEVGLLCLADPRPWGAEPNEIPPIGASPDALITHHLHITHADIQTARDELHASAAAPTPDATRAAARALLRRALERHTQAAAAAWAPGGAPAAPAAGNGTSSSSSSGSSTSTAPYDASYYRDRSLPLYDSGTGEAVEWLAAQLGGGAAAAAAAGVQLGGSVPAPSGSGHSAEGAGAGGGGSGGGGDVAAVVRYREIVEVKNHCPFLYKGQRKARKRGINIDYVMSDRGAVASLWPLWVPQLQAHLAAAGADSGLLLSRSLSRGVRVFRIYRDDAYLTEAFAWVRELQVGHVARKEPPGPDPWARRPGFKDFVARTVALAQGSAVVIETRTTPRVSADGTVEAVNGAGAFWKMR
ncbi:hypothetical protein HYH03_003359 [Edaphochlamys debaryana]|uniref:Uncharacterized protein n=1 Tax=Edaphochlamys debaryana TaxID=47281 RepID=A0A836C3B7_9CHLO|nr:hypothetical protein HYH03_003359 [Edaphochlamys debaryana]|eukprot:KAG2498610.1 hypothetical protein HYH03_003359 [Edaphochlamys debaryana]